MIKVKAIMIITFVIKRKKLVGRKMKTFQSKVKSIMIIISLRKRSARGKMKTSHFKLIIVKSAVKMITFCIQILKN